MIKRRSLLLATLVLCWNTTVPTYAIVGAGFHWGFDFTLNMDDKLDQPLSFEFTQFVQPTTFIDSLASTIPNFQSQIPVPIDTLKQMINDNIGVLEAKAPFSLSRKDWNRSVIDLGGKVFIDAIPVIDAIELSFNIGAWEYDASLKYPTGALQDNITTADIEDFVQTGNYEKLLKMDVYHLTLESFGMDYLKIFGISKTPYTKMNFDLSIRKNLVAVPDKMKIFKLYLGGGPSLHLGTPMMTPEFVEDVIASTIETAGSNINNLSTVSSDALMEEIVTKLIKDGRTPTFGMHILAGTMLKLPVIPLGFYVDAKFMIPFGKMDKDVDLGGMGFLLNAGVSLSL